MFVNWVKIDVGPKLQQKVNLEDLERVVFSRGPKSQL